MPIAIVDSHIHLFPASHLPSLAWHGPSNPLGSQHSLDEYRQATSSTSEYLRGFIFLETDRISSVVDQPSTHAPGWSHALDEVSLLTRIVMGKPLPEEGHTEIDRDLCLGIVPWAPVPGGPEILRAYMARVKERTQIEEVWQKVRGVRYLLQDKAAGIMLETGFVEGLLWLGREGLVFDLGVDARQGGLGQLQEAVEMMEKVYRGFEKDDTGAVTIVINHLCKPNLRLPTDAVQTHPEYLKWKFLITKMAHAHGRTYMKLSGAFSEFPPLAAEADLDVSGLVDRLQPWTDVAFNAFGPERVMFGSDWPVCNIGGGGNDVSWIRWKQVVEGVLERRGLTEEQRKGVWGGVAIQAYGISI